MTEPGADRGPLGDRVVRLADPARGSLRRLLGTPGGQEYVDAIRSIESTVSATAERLAEVEGAMRDKVAHDAATEQEFEAFADRIASSTESLEGRVDRLRAEVNRLVEGVAGRDASHRDLVDALSRVDAQLGELAGRVGEVGAVAAAAAADARTLAGRADATQAALDVVVASLTSPVHLAEPSRLQADGPRGHRLGYRADTHGLGADVLWPTEAEVTDRLAHYLPVFGPGEQAVDLGCGRGELLGLLASHRVDAVGVDLDPDLVAAGRAAGLAVEQADAVDWLERRPPASLDVVFAAQVLEHLEAPMIDRLVAAARRALRPGGRFVAETPNPYSPAALRAFWVDLTHVRPLYPEALLLLVHRHGFAEAYVEFGVGEHAGRDTAGSFALVAGLDGAPPELAGCAAPVQGGAA